MKDRLRQLWLCYRLQLKILLISPFEGFLGIVFPLMFATATLMVDSPPRRSDSPTPPRS